MTTKTPFTYEVDPDKLRALEQVRNMQRDLGDRYAIRQRLAFRVSEAKDALDMIRLKAKFERIPAQAIAGAQADYDAAQQALTACDQAPENPEAMRWIMGKVDELENREQNANMNKLRPIYADGLRRLDAKLREASAIVSELMELSAASGPLCTQLPNPLSGILFDVNGSYGRESQVSSWRHALIETGWLNK